MNKKGFTTVELVLTIVLVVIIMLSVINVTYTYSDRSNYEEIVTEVIDYKNTLTKIIYDDILNTEDPVVSITKIDENNYNLITKSNIEIPLIIIKEEKRVGVNYNGVEYLIPGSTDGLIDKSDLKITYKEDIINNFYSLDITFVHYNLEDEYRIHFVIS